MQTEIRRGRVINSSYYVETVTWPEAPRIKLIFKVSNVKFRGSGSPRHLELDTQIASKFLPKCQEDNLFFVRTHTENVHGCALSYLYTCSSDDYERELSLTGTDHIFPGSGTGVT